MKFKIGDKVKYTNKASGFVDYGDIGVVVNVEIDDCPYSVLFSCGTWWCMENNLIKVNIKNQQLLFDFMASWE